MCLCQTIFVWLPYEEIYLFPSIREACVHKYILKKRCKKQLLKIWYLLSGSTKLIRCVPDQGVLVRCSTRGKLCCRRWRLTRKPTVTLPPCSLAKSPAHSSSAPSTERSSPGKSLPTESPSSSSSTRLKKSYLRSISVQSSWNILVCFRSLLVFYMFIYFKQVKKTKLDVSRAVSSPNGLGRSKVFRGARSPHIISVTIIQVLWTSTKPVICQEVVSRHQSQ